MTDDIMEPVAYLNHFHRDGSQRVSFDRCHPDDGETIPLYAIPPGYALVQLKEEGP